MSFNPATPNSQFTTPQIPRQQPTLQPQVSQSGASSGAQGAGAIPANPYLRPDANAASNYRGPPPIEVYTLPENADASIPDEIRYLFQTDEAGRVLFFSAPPVWEEGEGEIRPLRLGNGAGSVAGNDVTGNGVRNGVKHEEHEEEVRLGHSARYLAAKLRRRQEIEDGRIRYEEEREGERKRKRSREVEEQREVEREVQGLKRRAVAKVEEMLAGSVRGEFEGLFGGSWEGEAERRVVELGDVQALKARRAEEAERVKRERQEGRKVKIGAVGLVGDGF